MDQIFHFPPSPGSSTVLARTKSARADLRFAEILRDSYPSGPEYFFTETRGIRNLIEFFYFENGQYGT